MDPAPDANDKNSCSHGILILGSGTHFNLPDTRVALSIVSLFEGVLNGKLLQGRSPFVPGQKLSADGRTFRLMRVYAYNHYDIEKTDKLNFGGKKKSAKNL